jgi:DNA polymerase
MNKQINIEETLDWYILAGVTETCSDKVCLVEDSITVSSSPEKNVQTRSPVSNVLKNARDICSTAQTLEELKALLMKFDGCSLKNTANSTVFGEGNTNAKVMLIGEAPGADEDRIGRPFVGKCGKLLDKMLSAISVKREDCYISNVLPWRPPGNRTPTDEEIAICLPFLRTQIELINPDFILLLGGIALKSVMDCSDSISRTRGKWMEYSTSQGKVIPVLATYHPSYLLRSSSQKSRAWTDLLRLKDKMQENM